MGLPLLPTIIIGGIAYEVVARPRAPQGAPPPQRAPAPGATVGQAIAQKRNLASARSGMYAKLLGPLGPSPTTKPSGDPTDPMVKAAEQAAEEAGKQWLKDHNPFGGSDDSGSDDSSSGGDTSTEDQNGSVDASDDTSADDASDV